MPAARVSRGVGVGAAGRGRLKHPLKKVAGTLRRRSGDRLSANDAARARRILHPAAGVGLRFYIWSVPGFGHVGALGHLRGAGAGILLVAVPAPGIASLNLIALIMANGFGLLAGATQASCGSNLPSSIASVRSRIRVAIGAATEPPCSPPCTMTAMV